MSFINPTGSEFVLLSPSVAWIRGLQLNSTASGTISFAGGAGELLLPEGLFPGCSCDSDLRGTVKVTAITNSAGPLTNLPLSVGKAGLSESSFLITLVNTNVSLTTQEFEVYVEIVSGKRVPAVVVNVNV